MSKGASIIGAFEYLDNGPYPSELYEIDAPQLFYRKTNHYVLDNWLTVIIYCFSLGIIIFRHQLLNIKMFLAEPLFIIILLVIGIFMIIVSLVQIVWTNSYTLPVALFNMFDHTIDKEKSTPKIYSSKCYLKPIPASEIHTIIKMHIKTNKYKRTVKTSIVLDDTKDIELVRHHLANMLPNIQHILPKNTLNRILEKNRLININGQNEYIFTIIDHINVEYKYNGTNINNVYIKTDNTYEDTTKDIFIRANIDNLSSSTIEISALKANPNMTISELFSKHTTSGSGQVYRLSSNTSWNFNFSQMDFFGLELYNKSHKYSNTQNNIINYALTIQRLCVITILYVFLYMLINQGNLFNRYPILCMLALNYKDTETKKFNFALWILEFTNKMLYIIFYAILQSCILFSVIKVLFLNIIYLLFLKI